jgi:hypothetical protein
MNFTIDENCSSKSLNYNKSSSKKVKFISYNNSIGGLTYKGLIQSKLKDKDFSRIFKLEILPTKTFKNIKIEYSNDKNLLDKLFEMKNMVGIKKKTFI